MTAEVRRFLFGLGALVLGLLLSAGLLLDHATRPRADFAFCNQQEIESLDPAEASGVPSARIQRALLEGLVRRSADGRVAPGLAKRWSVSADGLLWTFELRADAFWSDGRPVRAADVVGSLRRVLDPATASRHAKLLEAVKGAKAFNSRRANDPESVGLRAPDPLTVEIELKQPTPTLPQVLATPQLLMVPLHVLAEHGRAWTRPEHFVGNGPYLLAERILRDRVEMVRNPDYWGAEEVRLQTITAYAAEGISTQLNLYLTGAVDWIIKPPPQILDELMDDPDLRLGPQFGTTFLRFNVHGGAFAKDARPTPLADPRVRRALTLALDRLRLARDVMRGGHEPIDAFVPGGLPDYEPAHLPAPNPERARELLAEAGYPGGEGLPQLRLLYPHNETNRDFCDAVVTMWRRELGIDVKLTQQVWKVYLDSSKNGLYQIAWGAWIGDWLDATDFVKIFHSESLNNRTGWGDDAFDKLIDAASAEPDDARRLELVRAAEARLLAELPIAPVYQRTNINLVAPHVVGWEDNLLDVHPLRDIGLADGGGSDSTREGATRRSVHDREAAR